jgi:hypothetical protein
LGEDEKETQVERRTTATGPEKTDVGKKDPKRMKESQSPRTTAQKLIAEDELVPLPRFITAKEMAERKAREAREKDERRRVNFAGPRIDGHCDFGDDTPRRTTQGLLRRCDVRRLASNSSI